MWCRRRKTLPAIAGFEDSRGLQPRNTGSVQQLEKPREHALPQSLRRGLSPASALVLAQRDPFQTPDLQNSQAVALSH